MTDLFACIFRPDFGLGNPNKAAAVLAVLFPILLSVLLRTRRTRIAAAVTASSCLLVGALALTQSRGGLLALAAGTAVLVLFGRRTLDRHGRRRHLLLIAAVLAAATVATGFSARIAAARPSADRSVGNRLLIWSHVPRMTADAPGGWGKGNAGAAYMSWYQPLGRTESYRTLVNGPLTVLVETGRGGRWTAFFATLLLAGLLVRHARVRGDPLPLAVWSAFAVSAWFSTVSEHPLTWVVPLLASIPLFRRARTEVSPDATFVRTAAVTVLVSAAAASALLALIPALARFFPADGPAIRLSPDRTRLVVGPGTPSRWIVYDAATMGGDAYGRALRRWISETPDATNAVGIVFSRDTVPADAQRIVLCGKAASEDARVALARVGREKEIRILSPPRPELWLNADDPDVRVFAGELSPSCPPDDHPRLTVVTGRADYLPEWPRLAFGP